MLIKTFAVAMTLLSRMGGDNGIGFAAAVLEELQDVITDTNMTLAPTPTGGTSTQDEALDCSAVQEIWEEDSSVFTGTEFVEIKELCDEGLISTAEDITAILESVAAPNPSIDDQITRMADNICKMVETEQVDPDADITAIEAACSAEPRDDEAVVDASSKLSAEMTPEDEEADADLEETCISISANRDKIEAALLVLAERSSHQRKLHDDSGNGTVPVTSFEVASDMLSMYDCLCDQSNPDNIGCLKKTLKLTELVAQSVEEQAATDFNPESILNDLEETVENVKKHTSHLRTSGYDINGIDLSVERALSDTSVGACNPPGISDTWQNGGKKLCLYAGNTFECEVNWNPHSAGCLTSECGGGNYVQLKGSVQLCFPGPTINIEIKLCVSVISEILEAIGIWVPGAESFFNGFNIYSGCYRLAYATYDVSNERLKIDVGPFRRHVPNTLNVWVRVGGKAALRFKGSGCGYFDDMSWAMYERAARSRSNSGEIHPNNYLGTAKNDVHYKRNNGNYCPFHASRWAIFQVYVGVELDWPWVRCSGGWPWEWRCSSGISTDKPWTFDKSFVAK